MRRGKWRTISADALGMIERSLHMDSSIPTGMLMPVPDGIGDTGQGRSTQRSSQRQGSYHRC